MAKNGLPRGFEDLLSFGLIESLLGRRSRRFFMGAEIPDGVFTYKSRHDPVPLSELEKEAEETLETLETAVNVEETPPPPKPKYRGPLRPGDQVWVEPYQALALQPAQRLVDTLPTRSHPSGKFSLG